MTVRDTVSIVMGSKSDLPIMQKAADILKEFNVPYEICALSTNRTPEKVVEYANGFAERNVGVVIVGDGMAAQMPGVIAGLTTLPVIGVPIECAGIGGFDALLSTVRMPQGMPVATVSVGNSRNAALLAVAILAVSDDNLAARLIDYRFQMKKDACNANEKIQ